MAALRGTWDAVVEGRNYLYGRTFEGTPGETAVARASAESIDPIEAYDAGLHDCQAVVDEARLALEQGVDPDPVTALATVGARVGSKLRPLSGTQYLARCFAEAAKQAAEPASKALATAGAGLGHEWFLIPSTAQGAYAGLRDGMMALAGLLAGKPGGEPERVCAAAALQLPEVPPYIDSDRVFVEAIQKHASSEEVSREAARLVREGNREERKVFLMHLAPAQAAAGLGLGLSEDSRPLEVEDQVVRIGSITLDRRPESPR